MERYDSGLFEYFKSCETYEPKTKTIDISDLQHLCIEYRLSLRDCKDCIKIDSSQRVPFSEVMRYIRDYAYRKSGPTPPNMHPIHNSYSPVYRHPYFEGSYTPGCSSEDPYTRGDIPVSPPDQDPHDPVLMSRVPDMHWVTNDHHQPSSRASPSGLPSNGEGRVPSDSWYQTDSDDYSKGRYCKNCKSYQKQCQSLKDKLKLAKSEIEHLHTVSDKTNKELQQYYQKHWQKQAKEYEGYLAVSERERLKLQAQLEKLTRSYQHKIDYYQKALRSSKREEPDSESSSSRGHSKGYYDEGGRRSKDDYDMERLQKLYSSLKQENDQLKEQLRETEREKWSLKDENQKLHCQLIKGDPLLQRHSEGVSRGGAKEGHPMLKTISTDHDAEKQGERDIQSTQKAKSVKSAPSEASDVYSSSLYLNPNGDTQLHIVNILNEDVTASVLPESFTPEQRQQVLYALQNCHSVQELITCLLSYSLSAPFSSQEGLVENDQLRSKIKHLEAELRRLSTSFDTVKQESEYMFCKLAQVEGNNCCLRHITKLCQQACEVHELLYEMKYSPSATSPSFTSFPSDNYSSDRNDLGKHVLLRARYLLNDLDSNKELQSHIPVQPAEGSLSGWNLSMSQYTATTSGLSSGVSSIGEAELNSNEIDQLKVYYQGLVSYASRLVGSLIEVDGLSQLISLKDPNVVKDSFFDKGKMEQAVADIEDYVDTEELCKIREEKAELRSQIYMMEQSKRSMELQVSRVQLQNNMLERRNTELQQLYKNEKEKRRRIRDKLKLYKSQADISHIPDNTSEAQQALDRSIQHSEDLYHFLQKHIQESQEVSDQLVEFVKELLSANRALVEAFERAKKRQQFEKRQLKQEILQLNNRLHEQV